MGARAVGRRWELGKAYGADDIRQAHRQVSPDNDCATSDFVDKQHNQEFTKKTDDGVDRLIPEGISTTDADLFLGLLVVDTVLM